MYNCYLPNTFEQKTKLTSILGVLYIKRYVIFFCKKEIRHRPENRNVEKKPRDLTNQQSRHHLAVGLLRIYKSLHTPHRNTYTQHNIFFYAKDPTIRISFFLRGHLRSQTTSQLKLTATRYRVVAKKYF